MLKSYNKLFIFSLLLLCGSCKKENIDYNIVQTGNVFNNTGTSVMFTARVLHKNDQIIEYGFIWYREAVNGEKYESFIYSAEETLVGDYFEQEISSGLEQGRSYSVLAYIKTTNGISYGRHVPFKPISSELVQVTGFRPDSITWYDTLMITGKNFGYSIDDIKVTAGSIVMPILKVSPDTILAQVPVNYSLTVSSLKVANSTGSWLTSQKLNLRPPVVYSIEPDSVRYYTVVTINGKYFNPLWGFTKIIWFNMELDYCEGISSNYIKFKVPKNKGYPIFYVKVFNRMVDCTGLLYCY